MANDAVTMRGRRRETTLSRIEGRGDWWDGTVRLVETWKRGQAVEPATRRR